MIERRGRIITRSPFTFPSRMTDVCCLGDIMKSVNFK